jgi:hypothetical protein
MHRLSDSPRFRSTVAGAVDAFLIRAKCTTATPTDEGVNSIGWQHMLHKLVISGWALTGEVHPTVT